MCSRNRGPLQQIEAVYCATRHRIAWLQGQTGSFTMRCWMGRSVNPQSVIAKPALENSPRKRDPGCSSTRFCTYKSALCQSINKSHEVQTVRRDVSPSNTPRSDQPRLSRSPCARIRQAYVTSRFLRHSSVTSQTHPYPPQTRQFSITIHHYYLFDSLKSRAVIEFIVACR